MSRGATELVGQPPVGGKGSEVIGVFVLPLIPRLPNTRGLCGKSIQLNESFIHSSNQLCCGNVIQLYRNHGTCSSLVSTARPAGHDCYPYQDGLVYISKPTVFICSATPIHLTWLYETAEDWQIFCSSLEAGGIVTDSSPEIHLKYMARTEPHLVSHLLGTWRTRDMHTSVNIIVNNKVISGLPIKWEGFKGLRGSQGPSMPYSSPKLPPNALIF